MPRSLDEKELKLLEQLIAEHPQGIGRADIRGALPIRSGTEVSDRALLRRLGRLIVDRRIASIGGGPTTRYVSRDRVSGADQPSASDEAELSLSTAAGAVRALVRRPLTDRTPVGYYPDLLLDYRPGETWYLDEDVRSRLHHLGLTPVGNQPAGTYARAILDRLLIDLSWASSRLEGNTYSRLDTVNLIRFGQRAEGKDAVEAQMILNHKRAIEMLVDRAQGIGLNQFTFRNLHAALAEGLMTDPTDEGALRTEGVQISGSVFVPLAVPQLLEEYFAAILRKADAIPDPFEQAFFVTVHIPYLQPFADVNKRVSRLGANIPLFRQNLCPLSFVGVPRRDYIEGILGMYELNRFELLRDVFVWAYQRSAEQYLAVRQAVAQPDPFRLRYREAMISVLSEIIHTLAAPSRAAVRALTPPRVSDLDRDRFVELTFEELLNLHDGSIARYRIRPSEFSAWRDRWSVLRIPEKDRP